jgi:PAS domain-containing protein
MGRRKRASGTIKPESSREATLLGAFERSRVPQALLNLEGAIVYANKGFNKLLGHDDSVEGLNVSDTTLCAAIPGLMRALRTTHTNGKVLERRASVYRGADRAPLELVCWFCPLPLPGTEIHLMIRVTEADGKPRRDE